jgi:hypothetical protein
MSGAERSNENLGRGEGSQDAGGVFENTIAMLPPLAIRFNTSLR